MMAVQSEYRLSIWRRFGLVSFVGFGEVADEVGNFELRNFKRSLGWGIRYLFNRAEGINVRLNFGYGVGSAGVYVTVGEAF